MFVCKMQIRVKTATRFLYFGPVAIAKQVNITAISTPTLITHIEREVYIRTPSSFYDAEQSLTVFIHIFSLAFASFWSRDNIVSIATRYGLESPGIETRWGEIFRTYPDRFRGPHSLLYNGYRVFPGGECGRGVMLTTHPFVVLRLRKS
jgi:hypothetical protein